jgi:hypothetical protein
MKLKTEVISQSLEIFKKRLEKEIDEKEEVSRYDMERHVAQIAVHIFQPIAEAL